MTTLRDVGVATGNEALGVGTTRVWYMRPEFHRDGTMGSTWLKPRGLMPTRETLDKTHVRLGEVAPVGLDTVFGMMQGECWSPNGEARALLEELGLTHTSMGVGDIIETNGVSLWLVDGVGFTRLPEATERVAE